VQYADGQCQTTTTTVCNDSNACTTEGCNSTTGQCQTTNTRVCNDNNACTNDARKTTTGLCQATLTATCNDHFACTTDVCDPSNGSCRFIDTCGFAGDLVLKLSSADAKTSYKRKRGGKAGAEYIKVTMSDILVTSVGGVPQRTKVGVKAVVTGPEAELASLVYPLAALKLGRGGGIELQNQGYDFTVVDTGAPCPDVLPADACTALAHRLSKAIDASLAVGPVAEREAFREAAQVFGVPPDTCVFIP
jgi:hypothetical protein